MIASTLLVVMFRYDISSQASPWQHWYCYCPDMYSRVRHSTLLFTQHVFTCQNWVQHISRWYTLDAYSVTCYWRSHAGVVSCLLVLFQYLCNFLEPLCLHSPWRPPFYQKPRHWRVRHASLCWTLIVKLKCFLHYYRQPVGHSCMQDPTNSVGSTCLQCLL